MRTFRAPATIAALAMSLMGLVGCGPSMTRLDELARVGSINRNAPVIAHVQIEIAAQPARVWALLVNASAWPQWDPDISKVSLTQPPGADSPGAGSLGPGVRFTWGEGSNTVHSEVQLFEPERRLAWTGTALTAKAIHEWELTPAPGGQTMVAINESMDGPLMAKLFSSQQLAESATAWLASLKKAAEQH